MYTTREDPGQDQFKIQKPGPREKAVDCATTSLKPAILLIIVCSISLAAFSTYRRTTRPVFFHWPELQNLTRYITHMNSDFSPTNISHIAFGIGGSSKTWSNRAHYSDLWFEPGVTKGFVFLDKNTDSKPGSKIPHRVSSEWRRFKRTAGSESAVRIARVVVDLFRAGLPDVRWFVMGDDDTVFFTRNLAAVLGKYEHREMVYVGGNSESVEQDVMHAYDMAFGGGGFAISYPLAAELSKVMDRCLDKYHYFYGSDQRVAACVAEFGVPLSREPGFHQIDIRGNPFGLLTAHPLAPLVSIHHLDHVKPLFPNQTQLDSLKTLIKPYEIDPSRILQQCFCYHHKHKWSVSISWGYTVQIYASLLTAKELETPLQTFSTWRSWSRGPFTFNTREVSSDPCKQPVIFYLDSIMENVGGETITAYKKFVVKQVKSCGKSHARATAIDNILVSASKMDPEDWNKVPRRHCCEIDGNLTQTMRIRIRKCEHSETITV